ncbi:MAG: carboxypeptidase regulatory-like domain-containing protein [Bacteroidota bacterium]|nr:carboxypeptidase regulatory-like domain-containing protein [Bacteroidota bacterium]MDX5431681.1 carboxypeptidase regulatory-like domain-containing protein [Bacteroidota bacterium]MDX5470396.1 carboxypeptidase regulatory-like domain-containing protein [Bacteroidota bacterium]
MKNVFLFFLTTSTLIGAGVLFKPELPGLVHGKVSAEGGPVWVAQVELLDSSGSALRSTLTDEDGAFRFDSVAIGDYRLRINHPSYVRKETGIHVSGGGALEVNIQLMSPERVMKEDEDEVIPVKPESPSAKKVKMRGEASMEYTMESVPPMEEGDAPALGAGTLTAGEINDFSKWALWEDLTETQFNQFQKQWGFFLKNRYSVQVTFKNGNPVVDAEVRLISNQNEVVYLARTDNTGKAELWADMVPEVRDRMARRYRAEVSYGGEKFKFSKLDAFPNGINSLQLEATCNLSDVMDVAFVVDATGSMGDEINYLKVELEDVIQRVKTANPTLNLRMGSVFYRDHGDQYLTRTSDFNTNIDSTLNFIRKQYAAGGGDFPEAVDEALDAALTRLSWSPEARGRVLFLILDAPPHQADSVVKRMQMLAYRAAAMGVRIIPVTGSGINKDVEFLMRSLALATNGTYTFLTDHSGVGNKHLEPSTDSYDVLKLNDLLVQLINRYAQVTACDAPSIEPPMDSSNTVIVPVDSAQTQFEKLELLCYPVPTMGPIHFRVSHPGGLLYLFDANGKLIMRYSMEERTLLQTDLVQLAAGMYLIRYEWKNQHVTQRIVKTGAS